MKAHPKGSKAEQRAKQLLKRKGYTFVAQNFHCRFGEIDLIFRDGMQWVFVEVKQRSSNTYGGAQHAISEVKLQRLHKTIDYYVSTVIRNDAYWGRVDVIMITGDDVHHEINVAF